MCLSSSTTSDSPKGLIDRIQLGSDDPNPLSATHTTQGKETKIGETLGQNRTQGRRRGIENDDVRPRETCKPIIIIMLSNTVRAATRRSLGLRGVVANRAQRQSVRAYAEIPVNKVSRIRRGGRGPELNPGEGWIFVGDTIHHHRDRGPELPTRAMRETRV